jgi:hypothetical protein
MWELPYREIAEEHHGQMKKADGKRPPHRDVTADPPEGGKVFGQGTPKFVNWPRQSAFHRGLANPVISRRPLGSLLIDGRPLNTCSPS